MEETLSEILNTVSETRDALIALYVVVLLTVTFIATVLILRWNDKENKRRERQKKKEMQDFKSEIKKEIIDYYNETKEYN